MDLDMRKLRYFAAVAEHEHFGRAAQQLYIAQPVLSRQIRALEQELGCELLVRSTRSVHLTPAGKQLQVEADALLGRAADATRRVTQAARGTGRLVVGFAPGLSIAAAVQAFESEEPDVDVQVVRLDWYEQAESLHDGRADVGFLRRPFAEAGLTTTVVGSESSVVCLPAGHPLLVRRQLVQADLAGETTLDVRVRRTTTVEEKLELVAAGRGLAVLPRSVATYYARPDIAHRVIGDAAPHELCVAAVKGRHQPLVLRFARTATARLTVGDLRSIA